MPYPSADGSAVVVHLCVDHLHQAVGLVGLVLVVDELPTAHPLDTRSAQLLVAVTGRPEVADVGSGAPTVADVLATVAQALIPRLAGAGASREGLLTSRQTAAGLLTSARTSGDERQAVAIAMGVTDAYLDPSLTVWQEIDQIESWWSNAFLDARRLRVCAAAGCAVHLVDEQISGRFVVPDIPVMVQRVRRAHEALVGQDLVIHHLDLVESVERLELHRGLRRLGIEDHVELVLALRDQQRRRLVPRFRWGSTSPATLLSRRAGGQRAALRLLRSPVGSTAAAR